MKTEALDGFGSGEKSLIDDATGSAFSPLLALFLLAVTLDDRIVIFDGGTSSVVLHDPRKGASVTRRLGWTNDDPPRYSKWLPPNEPPNERFPDD